MGIYISCRDGLEAWLTSVPMWQESVVNKSKAALERIEKTNPTSGSMVIGGAKTPQQKRRDSLVKMRLANTLRNAKSVKEAPGHEIMSA